MTREDEVIGTGSTTLDYLRARYEWLGELIDESAKRIKQLENEVCRLRQESDKDHDAIKAEIIRIRKYCQHHGVPIGECVAWCNLKKMFGAGMLDKADWDWLEKYERNGGSK